MWLWWIISVAVMAVIGWVVGYFMGTCDVFVKEYQAWLHEGRLFLCICCGAGITIVILVWLYFRKEWQKLMRLQAQLHAKRVELKATREAIELERQDRSKIIRQYGSMWRIDLTEAELESDLGKQIRDIEQALREPYKEEINAIKEYYEFEIKKLKLQLPRDMYGNVSAKPYYNAAKVANSDNTKLVEGPPHRKR